MSFTCELWLQKGGHTSTSSDGDKRSAENIIATSVSVSNGKTLSAVWHLVTLQLVMSVEFVSSACKQTRLQKRNITLNILQINIISLVCYAIHDLTEHIH